MESFSFFNRDISWLSFNERVLMEAASESVPLLERLKFLAIFSSNLDEFFRVRIPAVQSLHKLKAAEKKQSKLLLTNINDTVYTQQEIFGSLLENNIFPQLKSKGIYVVYNEAIPEEIKQEAINYFLHNIAAYLKVIFLKEGISFFPENNKLYFVTTFEGKKKDNIAFINIPSDNTGRFFLIRKHAYLYVLFIDDIIRICLPYIFPKQIITGAYPVKVTRDAELDLEDELEGDLSEKIEQQLSKRDLGLVTRFLFAPGMPENMLKKLVDVFNLRSANMIAGGNYHNLKDFSTLPVNHQHLVYPEQTPLEYRFRKEGHSLLDEIDHNDIMLHTPYYSYNTVLRFFNEASIDTDVEEIFTTLYRVASDSKIVNALISAAINGKKVTVFVELKARFDEANNIKWGKRMKTAGIKVIYSIPGLKVHAKIALLKRKRNKYSGLLATGNLNESTARFYTDHVLLTASPELLADLEKLFGFLAHSKKSEISDSIRFTQLLVSQFNLQDRFLQLIQHEIDNAKKGLPASIIIKLNNLEEKVLISRLYEASNTGVKINLIVRSVCCLIPGIPHMSENIKVKRIVDRYLEHGRVFIFHNNGDELVFMGSADWMNRNIYRRIEVCFPVLDHTLKQEIRNIINMQLKDTTSAVQLNYKLENTIIESSDRLRSQEEIMNYLRLHN
jgi:polyphosphate kinase